MVQAINTITHHLVAIAGALLVLIIVIIGISVIAFPDNAFNKYIKAHGSAIVVGSALIFGASVVGNFLQNLW